MSSVCKDPFRLCFPVALFFAFYACILWIGFALFDIGEYPGTRHAELFIGGFILFSILGFLETAIPRFTQTDFAKKRDIIMLVILTFLAVLSTIFNQEKVFWVANLLGHLQLFFFAFSRFRNRKSNPPYTFVFVGLGLVLGLIGSLIVTTSLFINLSWENASKLGKVLYYDGLPMALIFGVGGRLIPGILGHTQIVNKQRQIYERPISFLDTIPLSLYLMGILFIFGLSFDFFGKIVIAYIFKSIVIAFIGFKYWRVHEDPSESKWHGHIIRASCCFMMIATWTVVVFPDYALSIRHLIYISGYSLMTFLVAGRVVLAHSKQANMELEKRVFPYGVIGFIFILAALTRASAELVENSFIFHLGYAGLMFLIGLLIWTLVFAKKILEF
ncbi:MAG: NnrS family protein [Halobacteriovoraceae bacterium]|nr:NnrS family protein [Halobacteriovoraceae bacterium]